jgi:hypothetical protein
MAHFDWCGGCGAAIQVFFEVQMFYINRKNNLLDGGVRANVEIGLRQIRRLKIILVNGLSYSD